MKILLIILISLQFLNAEEVEYFEGRKGFHAGTGIVLIGSKEGAIPLLDLEIGYNPSKQVALSIDVKTLGIGSLMGIKAKYYLYDLQETSFVSLTGGALDVGGVHSGFIGSYNNIEWGYAFGRKEFSIGIGVPYKDREVLAHLSYKYIF